MKGDRKRFSLSFEMNIYDSHGGGICGSSSQPAFRIEVDNITPDLRQGFLGNVVKAVNESFDSIDRIAKMQDNMARLEQGNVSPTDEAYWNILKAPMVDMAPAS